MPAADVEEEPGSVEQTDAAPELELEPEPEPEPKLIVEVLLVRFHPSNKKLLAFLKRRETEDLWESTTFACMHTRDDGIGRAPTARGGLGQRRCRRRGADSTQMGWSGSRRYQVGHQVQLTSSSHT